MLSESDGILLETMTSSADAELTAEQVPALQNGVFVVSPEVCVKLCACDCTHGRPQDFEKWRHVLPSHEMPLYAPFIWFNASRKRKNVFLRLGRTEKMVDCFRCGWFCPHLYIFLRASMIALQNILIDELSCVNMYLS